MQCMRRSIAAWLWACLRYYQHKLIKMRAELAGLNHCAVPFLSRAIASLCGTAILCRAPSQCRENINV